VFGRTSACRCAIIEIQLKREARTLRDFDACVRNNRARGPDRDRAKQAPSYDRVGRHTHLRRAPIDVRLASLDYAANKQIMQLLKTDFRQIVSLTKGLRKLTLSCCKVVGFATSVHAGKKHSAGRGDMWTPAAPPKLMHSSGYSQHTYKS
jgi:hypothetical protein